VHSTRNREKRWRRVPAEDIKQRHTYQREQQVLQIDDREGEAEKRQNGVRVEQEDEIKEGVK
jgi:hypothetical protein